MESNTSAVGVWFVNGRYYDDIRNMPPITEQDMNAMLYEESMVCPAFNA